MSDTKPTNKPSFTLYTVRGEGENASWSAIGAAWEHKDGSGYSIRLDSVPLNGRIVMRRPSEKGGAQ